MNELLHDVLISNLDRPEQPNGSRFLRAIVKQITESGDILAEIPGDSIPPILCDVLFAGSPFSLSVDDVVLLWVPSTMSERGIVLGRVRKYNSTNEATETRLS